MGRRCGRQSLYNYCRSMTAAAEFGESGNSAPSFLFTAGDFRIFQSGEVNDTGLRGTKMRKARILFYIFLQCTWGILQTAAGFFLFLRYGRCPHRFFGGAVHTGWQRRDGISLGLFIFSPQHEEAGADNETDLSGRLILHEYGHTFQSLMLGPLYFPIIGIPSALWANCRKYKELREKYGVPYSFCFAEGWADRLGKRMMAYHIASGRKDR